MKLKDYLAVPNPLRGQVTPGEYKEIWFLSRGLNTKNCLERCNAPFFYFNHKKDMGHLTFFNPIVQYADSVKALNVLNLRTSKLYIINVLVPCLSLLKINFFVLPNKMWNGQTDRLTNKTGDI